MPQDFTNVRPKLLSPNEHLEYTNGTFVRMPGPPPKDDKNETVLDAGQHQIDSQQVAQQVAQSFDNSQNFQAQPIQPAPTTPIQPINNTPVNTAAPVNAQDTQTAGVVNTVASVVNTAVEAAKLGAEAVESTSDMVNNLFTPGN